MLLQNQRKHAGFTLMELMVIVVLIGIAAAVVVPNFAGSMRAARSDRAAIELQADLHWAISRARATGRSLRVVFSGSGYEIRDAADSTQVLRQQNYGDAATFASSNNPLIMPWGMVQPGQIYIEGSNGLKQLDLLPTGQLRHANGTGMP